MMMKLPTFFLLGVSLIGCCRCCSQDNLWDLVTCGPITMKRLLEIRVNGEYKFCGSDTLTNEQVNRDVIKSSFTNCHQTYRFTDCSSEQQEGLVTSVVEGALDAAPCNVINDANAPPECADEVIKCIHNTLGRVVQMGVRGTACICRDRDLVKTATLNNCINLAPSLDSCTGLSSGHKTALETSIATLRSLLDNTDCSSVNNDECNCYENVVNCIEGSATHQGNINTFTEQAWSLVEETAIQNANDTNAQQKEKTRAWIRYQQCRTTAFPDQFDRAVKCIVNSNYVSPSCGVVFPETLAFAEHNANVSFYQTYAAAVKNIADFCHVWCRNSSIWTGEMIKCLSGFHPVDPSDNAINYILRSSNSDIKAICDADQSKVDAELACAGNQVKECPYLPYHLIIADKYSFQNTLTSSDSMEAVYKILQACNKNTTEWALTYIAKRDDDKTSGGGDDFTGFFGNAPKTFLVNHRLLTLLAMIVLFLQTKN